MGVDIVNELSKYGRTLATRRRGESSGLSFVMLEGWLMVGLLDSGVGLLAKQQLPLKMRCDSEPATGKERTVQ